MATFSREDWAFAWQRKMQRKNPSGLLYVRPTPCGDEEALGQAEADRDAAWQTCRELAAALRAVESPANIGGICAWCDEDDTAHAANCPRQVALALVQPCGHPPSAIGGESAAQGGTRSCRACAALAAEVNHE